MARWETRGATLREEPLDPALERLKPLFEPKRVPAAQDWLATHEEAGQSFAEYMASRPVRPEPGRDSVVLQPIGELAPAQRRVLDLTAEWVGAFYALPVRLLGPLPAALVPAFARRRHPAWGNEQILTTYVLHELLVPRRPDDAVAYLALTATDLYPAPGWNFVFGQASLNERIGVWSLYRNDDPARSAESFRRCLRQTLGTAVHELAHMLGVLHCIAFECAMNGSNHRDEADRRPLWLCPCCLQKLCWNVGCEPPVRFSLLASLSARLGLETEAAHFARIQRALEGGVARRGSPEP